MSKRLTDTDKAEVVADFLAGISKAILLKSCKELRKIIMQNKST